MSRKPFLFALFFVAGLGLGALAYSLAATYTKFQFEPKLTLGDVFSATTAIFVAMLVAKYLEKQNSQDNNEKAMLLTQLDDTLRLIQEFETVNEKGKLTQIISSLTRLKKANNSFVQLVTSLNYPDEVIVGVNCEELIREIRKLSTETPVRMQIENHAKRAKCSTVVKNGIVSLAEEKKNLLDQKIDEIRAATIKGKILINKV